jgi:hypothetical protein
MELELELERNIVELDSPSPFSSPSQLISFINRWFQPLYECRQMQVYKKGRAVKVGNRTWWVG